MHSITLWKQAERPNYSKNIDKVYPYSEVPYLGEYHLVKIPLSLNNLIDHVDYWGEGRIETSLGSSGFSNCYNVNHPYQLVSNGSDRDKKIPNRIPVLSYTNCDTSAYIKDNSVTTVTLMGAPINSSCAADIARMVNNDIGTVVVYGFDGGSQDIANLTAQLKNKSLYHRPGYTLPSKLQGITLIDKHMAFLNLTLLKDELLYFILNDAYGEAVSLSKSIDSGNDGNAIGEVVQKLLSGSDRSRAMSFGYQLWNNGGKNIVRNHFPAPFKLIFSGDNVKIVNKGYNQALKLDANTDGDGDRLAWGDSSDQTSRRVIWRFYPTWRDHEVIFKIYNVDCDMYLKSAVAEDNIGDRQIYGSKNSDTDRHVFYVEPFVKYGALGFYIINYEYRQELKLAVSQDSYKDRLLWGHNGDIYKDEGRFKWTIAEI